MDDVQPAPGEPAAAYDQRVTGGGRPGMRGVKRFLKGKPAPKGFRTCAGCGQVFPRDQVYTTGHCATCEPIQRKKWLDAVPGRRAHDARVKRDRKRATRAAAGVEPDASTPIPPKKPETTTNKVATPH